MQETPAATAIAVLELLRAGRFEEIRDLFAEPLRPLVSAAQHVDQQVVADIAEWLELRPTPSGGQPPPPA